MAGIAEGNEGANMPSRDMPEHILYDILTISIPVHVSDYSRFGVYRKTLKIDFPGGLTAIHPLRN
jgi:hypothetical protein